MIGPRPIETVGNCQKLGISQGCGYDESPCWGRAAFAAKMFEILFGQPSFDEGPRVHSRRGMSLEIDEVARVFARPGVKEMVKADFVQRRRRGKGRNVAADAGIIRVGPRDHGHRVPADDALDPPFDLDVAGIARLFIGRKSC